MQRYITFLSGNAPVSTPQEMEQLRRLFVGLGLSGVETYLQPGNVVFETSSIGLIPPFEAQLKRYLTKTLGRDVEVFVRTAAEVEKLVQQDPYPDDDSAGSRFVVFLHEPVSDKVQRNLRYSRTAADDFRARGREIYWLRRQLGDSREAPPSIAETLGTPATVRSFNTLRKIVSKYGGQTTVSARSRH